MLRRLLSLKVLMVPLIVLSVAGVVDSVRGAPSFATLISDSPITFTQPGLNTAHDINVVDELGALRFYGCPNLTNPPNCAAIQFFGNSANVFGGQAYIDSGSTPGAAIIFRTAASGGVAERMRITSSGLIGMGTSSPQTYFDFKTATSNTSTNSFRVRNSSDQNLFSIDDGGHVVVGALRSLGSTAQICHVSGELTTCTSAAEYVPTVDGGHGLPGTADLVSIAPTAKNPFDDDHSPFVVAKSAQSCDPNLLGFLLRPESGANGTKLSDDYQPLAIYGYFPARVTMENGAIKRGDAITSSSTPGAGMKATASCKTVGYALEDADEDGTIQLFSHLSESSSGEVAALRTEMAKKSQQVELLLESNAALEARLSALERAVGTAPFVLSRP